PGAMGQLVGGDGANHADHQAGDQERRDVVNPAGGLPRGQGIVAGQGLDEPAKSERIARADAPDGGKHDQAQQRQRQPELQGQNPGIVEPGRAGVLAQDRVAHNVGEDDQQKTPGNSGAAQDQCDGTDEADQVKQEELEVVKNHD